jgi:intracellular septation protein
VFFFSMGVLNRYVAWRYSTDTWVNFKLFGSMGLMILFMVAQGFYLSRHLEPDEAESNLPPR